MKYVFDGPKGVVVVVGVLNKVLYGKAPPEGTNPYL